MRYLVVIGVGAAAVAGWMGSKQESNKPSPPPPAPQTERIDPPVDAMTTAPSPEDHEPPIEPVAEDSEKYSALLDQLPLLTASRLRTLLATRGTPDLARLAAREREISLLLNAQEYALYEQLRESDDIRAHLQTFADQVQTTSPLHPQQQRALLLAKLNHSAAAQLLVFDPELDQSNIPAMERAYARDVAAAGIDHHKRAFLDEVRPLLTREQWSALAEFEHASLAKLLDSASENRSAVPPPAHVTATNNP